MAEQNAYHEIDRTTEGFEIFFWVFHDKYSYVPPHWHTAIEINYVINGGADIILSDRTIHLGPGDINLLDSTVIHAVRSIHGNDSIVIQLPYPMLVRYIPDFDRLAFSYDCHATDPDSMRKRRDLIKVLEQMQDIFEKKPDGGILKFNSLIFELMHLIYQNLAHPKTSEQLLLTEKTFDRLKVIMRYSDEHYAEPITLSQIASVVALQEAYFCHFFKQKMGVTYFQYLNELRLSRIYSDLLTTDLPVKDLMEKHGFTNYKVFRRMFLDKFHTTPGEYRKAYKKDL